MPVGAPDAQGDHAVACHAAACGVLLAFGLIVTLSWRIESLKWLIPDVISLIYPIYKSHLDPVRLLHFLALAVLVSRFIPRDWHGMIKPWMVAMIRCGENSLPIYCFSVLLSFLAS
jgi:OpgC protein.